MISAEESLQQLPEGMQRFVAVIQGKQKPHISITQKNKISLLVYIFFMKYQTQMKVGILSKG